MNGLDDGDKYASDANYYLKGVSEKYPNVYFIDRSHLYRGSNTFEKDGFIIPYSLDGGHISMLGSKKSAEYFMNHSDFESIMDKFDFE